MSKYYVGDVGTDIIVDTLSDLSTATVTNLIVRKPDSPTPVVWAGTVVDTTKIKYTTLEGDFNVEGRYYLQARVVMPGWSGLGETATFTLFTAFS